MSSRVGSLCRGALVLMALAGLMEALARPASGAGPAAHTHGTATMRILFNGPSVEVELRAPGASLVGFEHAPRGDMEAETLRQAGENLRSGEAMIRFSAQADCRLTRAKANLDLPTLADGADRSSTQGDGAESHADITAFYRFECARPEMLDSAALGLFMGFPALQRVLVRYEMESGRGGAELTRANPVVSFVPFCSLCAAWTLGQADGTG